MQESPSGSGNPGSHRELATRTRSPLARAPTIVHVPGAQRCRRVKNLGAKNSSWRSSLNLEAHTPPSPVGQFRTRWRETGISGCARSASSCPSRRQRDQARSVLILRTDLLLADQPLHGRGTREFRPAATSSLFLRNALGQISSAHACWCQSRSEASWPGQIGDEDAPRRSTLLCPSLAETAPLISVEDTAVIQTVPLDK